MPTAPTPESSSTTRRAALVVATLTSFTAPFLSSSVNVALPSMGSDLGMGAVSLAWINTAFLLASSVLLVPFGRLAQDDEVGDLLPGNRAGLP